MKGSLLTFAVSNMAFTEANSMEVTPNISFYWFTRKIFTRLGGDCQTHSCTLKKAHVELPRKMTAANGAT